MVETPKVEEPIFYEEKPSPIVMVRRKKLQPSQPPKHRFHKQELPVRNSLERLMKAETLSRKKEIKYLYTLSSPKEDGLAPYTTPSGRQSRNNRSVLPTPTKYPWDSKDREILRTYKQSFNF